MNCGGDLECMIENEWVCLEKGKEIQVAQEDTLKYQTMNPGWKKLRVFRRGCFNTGKIGLN